MTPEKIQTIHDEAKQVLVQWISHIPVDRRAKHSLQLLAEAVQLLSAAALNMTLVDEFQQDDF
jgi:hypothetical protein